MSRACGPCADKTRNELDRRLLEMDITSETFRSISREFGYHVDALRRHKENHLTVDLADIRVVMEQAREKALAAAYEKELAEIKDEAVDSMASRLDNASSFLDQLREVRRRAAALLDQAEEAQDLRAAGTFLKVLREQIRLWAELEGRLAAQPQINFLVDPKWIELRTTILLALDPFPEAKEAVVHAIRE